MHKKRKHASLLLVLVAQKQNGNDRDDERQVVEELRKLNSPKLKWPEDATELVQ